MPDGVVQDEKDRLLTLLQTVLQQTQTQAITIALIQRDLNDVKTEAIKLSALLKDGTGSQPPLLVRSALVEKTLHEVGESVQELRRMMESRSGEDQKGRWHIVATVISGMLALASAIVVTLMAAQR